MSELKACPFCGATGVDKGWMQYSKRLGGSDQMMYFVVCRECQAEGPWDLAVSGAAEAWNTRAPDPLVAALVEAAEAAFNYHYRVPPWDYGPTFAPTNISETEMASCEAYRKLVEAQQ